MLMRSRAKMKKLLLLGLYMGLASWLSGCSDDCTKGTYEVDSDASDGEEFPQYLIRESSDIDGLSGYKALHWHLGVECTDCTDLDGLECMEEVDYLWVMSNPQLRTLRGLDGVRLVGSLAIRDNNVLENLDGLDNLSESIEGFTISGNPALNNLDGLGSLEFPCHTAIIIDNPCLPTYQARDLLDRVGMGPETCVRGNALDGCSDIVTDSCPE